MKTSKERSHCAQQELIVDAMKLTVGSTLGSLLCLVLCTVSLDPSQIQVYPETGGISGVFMARLKNKKYSFNATAAAEVCSSLGVRIATRAEVEMAQSKGLQTCRFGWVKEQIAVIPRIEGNEKCGQKKVGVIAWAASTSAVFEVFCFNSTGQSEATTLTTPRITTPVGSSPQAKATSSSLIQSTLFNKNFLSPSTSISSSFSTSVSSTFFHSTVSSAAIRSPHSVSPSIALQPLSTSTSSTSSSAATFSSTILSTDPFTYSSSLNTPTSNQTEQPPQPPPRASFGEVPMACVITAVMLVLMAAAGAVWYFKIKRAHRLPPWVRIRHKDAVEMWKHTDQQSSSKKKEKSSSSEDITLQLEEDTESS
ncbi:lymphatic vessel endothelial hyaluronic receptor 1b [Colossoma macropomum]|uniref:lymphatic vessel endothelial hyaluronic receptor 1b n=1 Tax=Colossoma macropomum TaxID=42526 RepID=UPI0018652F38|nr:lymphatic vessel endothelial hyaluronic receptor 1b [Colossoma macropomum]